MFSSTTVEAEGRRTIEILPRLPQGFGLLLNDENLCKYFLYHLVAGNVGLFNNIPIYHLHHDNIPLVNPMYWDENMYWTYWTNSCVCILTDGEVQFPADWIQYRIQGPIFSDPQLQFHCTRYRRPGFTRFDRYTVDLFTVSPVRGAPAPQQPYRLNYRAIKIHNPQFLFNYQGRRQRVGAVGPHGEPPSPFFGPPSI